MEVQEGGRQPEREMERIVTDGDVEEGSQAEKGKMGEPVTNEEVEEELGLEGNVEVKGDEASSADVAKQRSIRWG